MNIIIIIGIYIGLGLLYCSRRNHIKLIYQLVLANQLYNSLTPRILDFNNGFLYNEVVNDFNHVFGKKSYKRYYIFGFSFFHYLFCPIGLIYSILFLSNPLAQKKKDALIFLDFIFGDDDLNDEIMNNYYYNKDNIDQTLNFAYKIHILSVLDSIMTNDIQDELVEFYQFNKKRVYGEN